MEITGRPFPTSLSIIKKHWIVLYLHYSKIFLNLFEMVYSFDLLKEFAHLIMGQHDKTGEIHKVWFGSDQPNLVIAL